MSAPNRSPACQLPVRGLCAHRGAMELHAENSRAAFMDAIRLGGHMIEFDVRLSRDGHPMVIHDNALNRVTDGVGKVSDHTLKELKRLTVRTTRDTAGQPERLLTLREVLRMMPVNIWLNIHLKGNRRSRPRLLQRLIGHGRTAATSRTLGETVAHVVIDEGRLHQAFLTCDAVEAQAARQIDPRIQICYLPAKKATGSLIDDAIALGAQFVQFSLNRPPSVELVKRLKHGGLHSTYCCVSTRKEVEQLFALGIDFPMVNNIHELAGVGQELGLPPVEPVFFSHTG